MEKQTDLIQYFGDVDTWLGLAGLALFVFLILFRVALSKFLVDRQVPPRYATAVVMLFMVLVASTTSFIIYLAWSSAVTEQKRIKVENEKKEKWKNYDEKLQKYRKDFNACVENEKKSIQAKFVRSFSMTARARCPGGGCVFKSSSCNRDDKVLRYEAPGDYYIEDHELIKGAMNDGSVGDLKYSRDGQNQITSIKVDVSCDPPDFPGASGGWANATIRGTIRWRDEQKVLDRIDAKCRAEFPKPEEPKESKP